MKNVVIQEDIVQLPKDCGCGVDWKCGWCYVSHMKKGHKVIVVHRPADAPTSMPMEVPTQ